MGMIYNRGGFPLQVFLGLTYKCNLRCKHCYSKEKRKQPDKLTKTRIFLLLEELSRLGIFRIVFTHGENLLRQDFFEILDYAKNLNFHNSLLSNGLILGNQSFLIPKLFEKGKFKLYISLDSLNKNYHDNLRGREKTWKGAVRAINTCTKNNFNFGILVTLNTKSIRELESLIKFAIEKNAKEIHFLTVREDTSRLSKYFYIKNYPNIIKNLYHLKQFYKQNILVKFHDPLAVKILYQEINSENKKDLKDFIDENECQAGKYFASITPTGEVFPCNFMPLSLGNILNKTFSEIWDESSQQREKISSAPKICKKCNVSSFCRGGCKSFVFYQHGNDFSQKDPRCNFYKF